MNTVHVTLDGAKLYVVGIAGGKHAKTKTLTYADAAAAREGLANLVKGAKAQAAKLHVTLH